MVLALVVADKRKKIYNECSAFNERIKYFLQ